MIRIVFLFVIYLLLYTMNVQAYDDHGNRDPFWPLISPSGTIVNYNQDVSASDMILEGIVSDEDGNYTAIINGAIVKAGDSIGPYHIDKINAQKVFLVKGQDTFELNLKTGGE